MTTGVPTFKLNTGAEISSVALGCAAGFTPEDIAHSKSWFLTAAKAGYRTFDTAQIYGTEASLGAAIKESGLPREQVKIVTKLPWHRCEYIERSFNESLTSLGVDYVDVYLLHFPQAISYPTGYDIPTDVETILNGMKILEKPNFNDNWAVLEKLYESGKAKAIGVSNFSIKTLEALAKTAKVTPAVNQVEMSPYCTQNDLVEYCKQKGIQLMAYSPSGHEKVRKDPTIVRLAEKYNISANQLIMAWHVARGVLPVPKSADPERQKQNITLPKLSPEDVAEITGLDKNERIVNKPDENGVLYGWTLEQYGWA
ncbi:Aldo/keto reductase [Dendrothele bispora CBS 962.96]|uniref:Aldo/keto reductase n=1 Tax=Dendrothele bispora (strain CBS 962.96) TaxID=1314807 RepID=A0A4S8KJR9_DENBC|nr:Aldo/keto reductase [Dendrothele bispora CBS 962.96]